MTPIQEARQRVLLAAAHIEFQEGLNKHSYFKVNNRTLSHDLVQDTFVKTWTYLVKGGKIEVMKAFLYHVLNNLIVDEYRKRKMVSLDLMREKGIDPPFKDSGNLFNIIDGRTAMALIKHLPDRYQKVIKMRYIQDLSLTEMSKLTGLSKNVMAVQVHRGLDKLKMLYTEY